MKIPATVFGDCGVVQLGVLGSDASAIVVGAALSMVERYEASEPLAPVTDRSQSDLPVEMTT